MTRFNLFCFVFLLLYFCSTVTVTVTHQFCLLYESFKAWFVSKERLELS